MQIYKIANSDFFHQGKLYREGSFVSLSPEVAELYPNILIPASQSRQSRGSTESADQLGSQTSSSLEDHPDKVEARQSRPDLTASKKKRS